MSLFKKENKAYDPVTAEVPGVDVQQRAIEKKQSQYTGDEFVRAEEPERREIRLFNGNLVIRL
ncbi:MAG: hypothetical protein NTY75_04980 [Candidatus Shapirobacteria bacterium]|nr:hypothetical protein [Candidatus Shapirobacteria bacterium]